jgi:hypothetical protein
MAHSEYEILRQPPRPYVQPYLEGLEPTFHETHTTSQLMLETAAQALSEAQTAYNAASAARLITQLNVWIHAGEES